jgi:O-antigen/teichoic acid export membrane protein
MWMIPVCALLSVIFYIFNEWCVRKKKFVTLGKNRISNTTGIAGTSILFGLAKLQPGLIFGQIFGQIFSVASAIFRVLKKDRHLFAYVTVNKMKYFAKRYSNFPKFTMFGQILNTIGGQMPVFVISSKFGLYEAGLYMMVVRVMGIPSVFLGNSLADVFKQRAAKDYQTYGNCIDIYIKTVFSLIKITIIPFIVLFIIAPPLFEFVLGTEWYVAGRYARYLGVYFMLSLISAPVSWMTVIAEKQHLSLIWQMLYIALTVIFLFVGAISNDIKITLLMLCVA